MSMRNMKKNFWLWGTWGKRMIKQPFLTQKVDDKLRHIVIGPTFIIALKEDGKVVSWGEDRKDGCLGLGQGMDNCADPKEVKIEHEEDGKLETETVIDVQFGSKHVLALTAKGRMYCWGNNEFGQLGLGDNTTRPDPQPVKFESGEAVIQIIAVENQSYCLTDSGTIYAWGDNKDGTLALEHVNPRVTKPEPILRVKQETPVKKLELKDTGSQSGKSGKVLIAYVEMADPLQPEERVGGVSKPLGSDKDKKPGDIKKSGYDVEEKDVFQGVNLMRKIMDITEDWWAHILDVRHGAPYDDHALQANDKVSDKQWADDKCSTKELDTYTGIETLEKARYEFDKMIDGAKAQLLEIKDQRGTKTVKFMLAMFMDDCKLRREKIRRTISARKLIDFKRGVSQMPPYGGVADATGGKPEVMRLNQANDQLQRTLHKVREVKIEDIYDSALQDSIIECIEVKLQVHETQIECLKASTGDKADVITPALRAIREQWGALKHFSIYNLYQEYNLMGRGKGLNFGSDEEMLTELVKHSDEKIDSIINIQGKDQMISRDSLVPSLCYELLVENAELRKMCNTYQLKVLQNRAKDDPKSRR